MDFANAIIRLDAFWKRFGTWLAYFGSFLLIAGSFVVVADVSGRYLFLRPITGATEGLALALPYVAFLAMAFALAKGTHVRVTIIFDRLPRTIRLWADNFTCLVALFFLGALTYFGWMFFWESFLVNEEMMAQIWLPAWAGKFSLPVGIFIFAVQYLIRLSMNIGRLANKITVAEEVAEEMMTIAE